MTGPECGRGPGVALVTGTAGFIGMHLATRLLDEGWRVQGVDAVTETHAALKRQRLARLVGRPGYSHSRIRLETPGALGEVMAATRPDFVVHLAAEAGVRPSIEDPRRYLDANVRGTFELLEALRAYPPRHALLASTSSAYGASTDMPFVETMKADWPVSPYAATKKATETLAHAWSHIWGVPVTMFRFFTVYGPWGRPDMAYWLFTEAVLEGRPIQVFNAGRMSRDFVFVGDLVEAIRRLIDAVPPRPGGGPVPDGDSRSPVAPFRVVNIGKSAPDTLGALIAAIEAATGRTAARDLRPMQPGDIPATWADATLLQDLTGYRPDTPLSRGIPAFVDWYLTWRAS